VEYGFVFRHLAAIYPQKVLDVGTGTTALPHLMRNCGCVVTASDNVKDFWPSGMTNRHYHVINDDITKSTIADRFDLITCISVLEHIKDHSAAVSNMFALLRPGGHLLMTFPYSAGTYVQNVYELEGSNAFGKPVPFVTQSYSSVELTDWCRSGNGTVVDQEHWQFWDGSHWSVGKQLIPPRKVASDDRHQLSCVLIRKSDGPALATSG
jgi:2-polyprenyl-3-methyl-5-hydroxy-6-metoxy-1,4-benzoquinol methylase